MSWKQQLTPGELPAMETVTVKTILTQLTSSPDIHLSFSETVKSAAMTNKNPVCASESLREARREAKWQKERLVSAASLVIPLETRPCDIKCGVGLSSYPSRSSSAVSDCCLVIPLVLRVRCRASPSYPSRSRLRCRA